MSDSKQLQLTVQRGKICESNCYVVTSKGVTIHWTGFAFGASGRSQESLFQHLAGLIAAGDSLKELVKEVRGAFFAVVDRGPDHPIQAFVDNSGQRVAYCSDTSLSTSFLRMCEIENINSKDLSIESMLDFLQLGYVYFGNTLSPQIRKVGYDEILSVDPTSGKISSQPKGGLSIDIPAPDGDLCDEIDLFSKAIEGVPTSVDITGGFDSRLVACLLSKQGVDFETALSGTAGSENHSKDHKLGAKVAAALGRPYFYTEYDPTSLSGDLEDLLVRLDGMDSAIETVHRLGKLNEDRIRRGIALTLKGVGGELYKDFFWMQDFPFYRRKKTNLERLCRYRIEFELLSKRYLTDRYHDAFLARRTSRLKCFERYMLPLNTQTYDNIYYRERVQSWSSRVMSSCQRPEIITYAPLVEVEMVRIAFSAPRRKRSFNRLHREYITRCSPEAARVMTTDGTSAYASNTTMIKDATTYSAKKFRQLRKKILERLSGKTPPTGTTLDGTRAELLSTPIAETSLRVLKDHEILRPSVEWTDIHARFQEAAIVLGWFLNRLKG